MSKDPTVGMFVGDAEIERRQFVSKEEPPSRIWIDNAVPERERGCGTYYFEPYKPNPAISIPYVLATEIDKAEQAERGLCVEIVKDYAKMTVDEFRKKYKINTSRFGWIEVVAALEAARTAEINPASPLTVPACMKCGHSRVDREGRCVFEYRRLNLRNDVRYCGCKCELPVQGDTREEK